MSFKPERLVGHKEASEAGTPFYLAAELGPDHGGREFVLGAGSSHGGFFNAPLLPGEKYLPIQGVASTLNGVSTCLRLPALRYADVRWKSRVH